MSDIIEPVNLGNPDEIPVLQLAEEIIKLAKSSSKIVFKELPQDDPKIRQPDISKASEELKWKPNVPREEGLRLTFDYFKQKLLMPTK